MDQRGGGRGCAVCARRARGRVHGSKFASGFEENMGEVQKRGREAGAATAGGGCLPAASLMAGKTGKTVVSWLETRVRGIAAG